MMAVFLMHCLCLNMRKVAFLRLLLFSLLAQARICSAAGKSAQSAAPHAVQAQTSCSHHPAVTSTRVHRPQRPEK